MEDCDVVMSTQIMDCDIDAKSASFSGTPVTSNIIVILSGQFVHTLFYFYTAISQLEKDEEHNG